LVEDDKIPIKRVKIAIEIDRFRKTEPKPRSVILEQREPNDVLAQRPATATAKTATARPPSDLPSHKPTNHREKVVNGIKHELYRLQDRLSQPIPSKDEKRKLRSQEGTRFKSELLLYFPEYDEVIGNDPKEHRE
jgi:hypothetical protein